MSYTKHATQDGDEGRQASRTEDALRDGAQQLEVVGVDAGGGAHAAQEVVERLLVRRQ